MTQYLVIENRGTFGMDLISTLGASTSRGNENAIGQFGSGSGNAIALALREGLDIRFTSGPNTFTFGVDEKENEDITGRTVMVQKVVMKQVGGSGSRRTRDMGFALSLGGIHWTNIKMALREWISNAADASMALQGDYKAMRVEIGDEPGKWARDGFTRVWVQVNSEIRDYIKNLNKHFLIFKKDWDKSVEIIDKERPDNLKVYRKGVLVGEFSDKSLFDYNINGISLNENREIDRYDAKYAIGQSLKRADSTHLARVLDAVVGDEPVYEVHEVDHSYMQRQSYDSARTIESITPQWETACKTAFGSRVVCTTTHEAERVKRKGYDAVILPEDVAKAVKSYGVAKTSEDVLDHFEANGRERIELGDTQRKWTDELWELLEEIGVTKGKKMPPVHGYHDVMNEESTVLGYYDKSTNTIGINANVFDGRMQFTQTLLEEFSHGITGSSDLSRDIQNIGFQIATLMILRSQ
jgi:hypothetical protein